MQCRPCHLQAKARVTMTDDSNGKKNLPTRIRTRDRKNIIFMLRKQQLQSHALPTELPGVPEGDCHTGFFWFINQGLNTVPYVCPVCSAVRRGSTAGSAGMCTHIVFTSLRPIRHTCKGSLHFYFMLFIVFLPFNKYMPVGVKWLAARPSFAPSDNRCYLNHAGR